MTDRTPILTPERAALLGRVGGYAKWSRTSDRSAATAPARAGLLAKYEREVRAEAEAQGVTLSAAQLAERVEARRRMQLARARLAAHDKRRAIARKVDRPTTVPAHDPTRA